MNLWTRGLSFVLPFALLQTLTCNSVGCTGSGQNGSVTLQDTVTTLKEAQFKGQFHFNHNGRPFSLGNESYAGANVAIVAEGEVDFSNPTNPNRED
jgi:hypothetical protein